MIENFLEFADQVKEGRASHSSHHLSTSAIAKKNKKNRLAEVVNGASNQKTSSRRRCLKSELLSLSLSPSFVHFVIINGSSCPSFPPPSSASPSLSSLFVSYVSIYLFIYFIFITVHPSVVMCFFSFSHFSSFLLS